MNRYLYGIIILCYLGFSPVVLSREAVTQVEEKDPVINVGVFPRHSATDTVKMFDPMVEHLTNNLRRNFRLVIARDFKSFWKALSEGKYDVVHFNQYHYVRSNREFGYRVILVNEEFDSAKISGGIIVRKDSGINRLEDLRGKKVVFGGGPKAMQSYIIARYLLQKAGLNTSDYIYEFTKTPPNAILAPYYGRADAGGVGDLVLKLPAISKRIDTSKLTFLATHEPLSHLPWAVKKTMPISLASEIQKLLSNLHLSEKGKNILNRASLTGLHIARDADFNAHRKIIYEVLGERY